MGFVTVSRIITALMAIVGSTFVIPITTAVFCKEYSVILPFAIPMVASWILFLSINRDSR